MSKQYDNDYNLQETDNIIELIPKLRLDLIKEIYEALGINLGKSNNKIEYKNYMINDPEAFGNSFGLDSGDSLGGIVGGDPGETGLSNGMLTFICFYETGHRFGYTMTAKDLNGYDLHDAGGHKTYGYGLLCHPNGKYMDSIKGTWTQQELENIFKSQAKITSNKIDAWARKKGITINQNQKDAIASACYNFGMGFLNKPICNMIAQNPNNPSIKEIWSHLSDAQGKKYPGLIKRRKAEANWYFGIYS